MKGHSILMKNLLLSLLLLPWVTIADSITPLPEDQISSEQPEEKSPWYSPKSLSDFRLPDNVQIHGFASQSYIYTSANNYFGHTHNMGSLDFTEMGINGSWRPLSQLQTSMQIVYRRAGETDDSYVRIDFGFLDYSFYNDSDTVLGVRMGRVFNPYGLYNDTRDMPFTRPSIFLPQSIYFDINRNLALSSDGMQVYGEYRTDLGDFMLQVNGGYPRTNDPDLKNFIAGNLPGSLSGEPSWAGRLMYERDAGRIRLGISSSQLNGKYHPSGGIINFNSGTFEFSPVLFSAQYNAEKWSLTSEYAIRPLSVKGFGKMLPDTSSTGESYYFQGTYRILDNLETFLRYDALFWDTSDRNGEKYALTSRLASQSLPFLYKAQPAYSRFAKDISTGVRWDLTTSLMARLEYHYINGTGWVSSLENSNPQDTHQHWHMVAMSLNFRF